MNMDPVVKRMIERSHGRFDAMMDVIDPEDYGVGSLVTVNGRRGVVTWISGKKLYVRYLAQGEMKHGAKG